MAALKAYRPDIDGLRAIAVMSVAAYHYGLPVAGGFIGVDVFFVISGFLIGSLIYREALDGNFSYRIFYVRRARRILPALLTVLIATFLVALLLATPRELRDLGATALATVLSASNFELWRTIGYFRQTADLNPLLMTWSLGVEEQFYLLAPVCLMVLPRLRFGARVAVLAGLIVASLGLAMWGVRNQPEAAFFLLPGRAWELAAGVLLGVLDIERVRSGVARPAVGPMTELRAGAGLVLIVLPALVYDRFMPFPGVAAVPPVLGTVLLLDAGSSGINRRLLSAPAMRLLGLISYSLYLWHWPLISLARMALVREPSLSLRLALLALSIALAWATYRWIEQPFRRSRAPASLTLWRYAGAMGVVALATGSAFVLHGYPQRWPSGFTTRAEAAHRRDPCLALGGARPHLSATCYPKGVDRRLVALVGDSHAAALAPGLRAVAARAGMDIAQLTRASCPFLLGVSMHAPKEPRRMAECAAFDRRVMALLQDDARIGTVVIAARWRAGDNREVSYASTSGADAPSDVLLQRGLSGAIQALQRHGKQVVIVRDVPYLEFLPAKQLAACAKPVLAAINGMDGARSCDFVAGDDMAADAPSLAVLERVARNTGAQLIDPRAVLCGEHGCRIALEGRLLYRDQQHLTPAGSLFASAVFAGPLRSNQQVHSPDPQPTGHDASGSRFSHGLGRADDPR